MNPQLRSLTTTQIETLARTGNTAERWEDILVKDTTDLSAIRGCSFSGSVTIGSCGQYITDHRGVRRRTGLYNCSVINSSIGDNCLISNVGTYLANCIVEDSVIIEDTGKIACTGSSAFGNGVEVSVINEAGGREVPIFTGLSAQTAYITVMYRHRPGVIEAVRSLVADHCRKIRSDKCTVGKGTVISGCGEICDVSFGESAVVEGATGLSNGTVLSTSSQPTHIGTGVIARDFICVKGSRLSDGASLDHCFVGEACRLESGFMATHSLFFANSELAGGEAASVFGGPFTVSHHRSSLLIAGYFLFFNAGSGSNQSNHLFKAGAVHQGIHERGCKFGSNSYIILPSREGAFTVVIGKHTNHHDTSALPFSYLIEDAGTSSLHPAANLRSYGTHRDLHKWPARDKRGPERTDRINQSEHNPYLGSKIFTGLDICRRLAAREGVEKHIYNRIRIKNVVLKRGIELYRLAGDAAIGGALSSGRNEKEPFCRQWIDAAGMYLPRSEMERVLDMLERGAFADMASLEAELDAIDARYAAHAYAWGLGMLAEQLGHEPSPQEISDAADRGKKAAEKLTALRMEDARSDMDTVMETGYGIDSDDPEDRRADFRAVRKI